MSLSYLPKSAVAVLALVILTLAVIVQFVRQPKQFLEANKSGRLDTLLPREVSDWRSNDEPLGSNEALQGQVRDVLRYDDYVYRRFRSNGREFSVYIAHWLPGKMPTRLVAEHTPDRCWVENGWNRREHMSRRTYSIDGADLKPGEWRIFAPPDGEGVRHVLFWLLVGSESYDYRKHSKFTTHALAWWRSVLQEATRGRSEQFFIRVVSREPFDQLWRDPGFRSVMTQVASLGLYVRP
jgi:hypothetical protein